MLNRRHLRVKALQMLYAYQLSDNKVVKFFEKRLLDSVDAVYEMYISVLSLLIEVTDYTIIDATERANKFIPTEDDLRVNTKLHQNKFIEVLRHNPEYMMAAKKYKVSWIDDPEIVKTIFNQLKSSAEYQQYLLQKDIFWSAEKEIIKFIFKNIILKLPVVEQIFEEKFINWPLDKEVLKSLMNKTFKDFEPENTSNNKLAQLLPNKAEDMTFMVDLFIKTIAFDEEWQKLISRKAKNWDADRISLMDILLMKLAITELTQFSSIPIKVTINEYIELSKQFSTPKSNAFINGILDKILFDLQSASRIKKFGRGLA